MIGLIAISGAASAQDWHGFYLGVNGGYAWTSMDIATSTVFDPAGYFASSSVDQINADGKANVKPPSFTGGATVGINFGKGGLLFGLEGDWNYLNAKEMRSVTTTYSCCIGSTYTLSQTASAENFATARLRLGIAKPTTLLYITGGAAFANMKMSEDFTDTFGPAAQSGSHSEMRTGWTAGAGIEKAVGATGNWSVKLEYLYADLGTMTFQGGELADDGDPVPENPFTNTMKLTMNVARIGLNYRFK
jgi:outer membrane immunogenic protein